MISELNIKKFRGIYNLHIENLDIINVISGANNTGKTSISLHLSKIYDERARILNAFDWQSNEILNTQFDFLDIKDDYTT